MADGLKRTFYELTVCTLSKKMKVLAGHLKASKDEEGSREHCNKFKEIMGLFLDSTKLDYSDQVSGLHVALEQFRHNTKYLKPIPEVADLHHWLFMQSAKLLLSNEWQKIDEENEEKKLLLNELKESFINSGNEESPEFKIMSELLSQPWSNTLLVRILSGDESLEDSEVFGYFNSQDVDLVKLRIDMLIDGGCESFAVKLTSWLVRLPQFIHDANMLSIHLTLLYKLDMLNEFHQQCSDLPCHVGVQILHHVCCKESLESFTLRLSSTFLAQDLYRPTTYCCTKELLRIWATLQHTDEPEWELFVTSVKKMSDLVKNSLQVSFFVSALIDLFGEVFLPMCIEFFTKAFHGDAVRYVTYTGGGNEPNPIDAITSPVHMCFVLNNILSTCQKYLELRRLALVTAFSLNPLEDTLFVIEGLYLNPPVIVEGFSSKVQYNVDESTDVQSDEDDHEHETNMEDETDQNENEDVAENMKETVDSSDSVAKSKDDSVKMVESSENLEVKIPDNKIEINDELYSEVMDDKVDENVMQIDDETGEVILNKEQDSVKTDVKEQHSETDVSDLDKVSSTIDSEIIINGKIDGDCPCSCLDILSAGRKNENCENCQSNSNSPKNPCDTLRSDDILDSCNDENTTITTLNGDHATDDKTIDSDQLTPMESQSEDVTECSVVTSSNEVTDDKNTVDEDKTVESIPDSSTEASEVKESYDETVDSSQIEESDLPSTYDSDGESCTNLEGPLSSKTFSSCFEDFLKSTKTNDLDKLASERDYIYNGVKNRGRTRKRKMVFYKDFSDSDEETSEKSMTPSPGSVPKRRGRPPKKKSTIDDEIEESPDPFDPFDLKRYSIHGVDEEIMSKLIQSLFRLKSDSLDPRHSWDELKTCCIRYMANFSWAVTEKASKDALAIAAGQEQDRVDQENEAKLQRHREIEAEKKRILAEDAEKERLEKEKEEALRKIQEEIESHESMLDPYSGTDLREPIEISKNGPTHIPVKPSQYDASFARIQKLNNQRAQQLAYLAKSNKVPNPVTKESTKHYRENSLKYPNAVGQPNSTVVYNAVPDSTKPKRGRKPGSGNKNLGQQSKKTPSVQKKQSNVTNVTSKKAQNINILRGNAAKPAGKNKSSGSTGNYFLDNLGLISEIAAAQPEMRRSQNMPGVNMSSANVSQASALLFANNRITNNGSSSSSDLQKTQNQNTAQKLSIPPSQQIAEGLARVRALVSSKNVPGSQVSESDAAKSAWLAAHKSSNQNAQTFNQSKNNSGHSSWMTNARTTNVKSKQEKGLTRQQKMLADVPKNAPAVDPEAQARRDRLMAEFVNSAKYRANFNRMSGSSSPNVRVTSPKVYSQAQASYSQSPSMTAAGINVNSPQNWQQKSNTSATNELMKSQQNVKYVNQRMPGVKLKQGKQPTLPKQANAITLDQYRSRYSHLARKNTGMSHTQLTAAVHQALNNSNLQVSNSVSPSSSSYVVNSQVGNISYMNSYSSSVSSFMTPTSNQPTSSKNSFFMPSPKAPVWCPGVVISTMQQQMSVSNSSQLSIPTVQPSPVTTRSPVTTTSTSVVTTQQSVSVSVNKSIPSAVYEFNTNISRPGLSSYHTSTVNNQKTVGLVSNSDNGIVQQRVLNTNTTSRQSSVQNQSLLTSQNQILSQQASAAQNQQSAAARQHIQRLAVETPQITTTKQRPQALAAQNQQLAAARQQSQSLAAQTQHLTAARQQPQVLAAQNQQLAAARQQPQKYIVSSVGSNQSGQKQQFILPTQQKQTVNLPVSNRVVPVSQPVVVVNSANIVQTQQVSNVINRGVVTEQLHRSPTIVNKATTQQQSPSNQGIILGQQQTAVLGGQNLLVAKQPQTTVIGGQNYVRLPAGYTAINNQSAAGSPQIQASMTPRSTVANIIMPVQSVVPKSAILVSGGASVAVNNVQQTNVVTSQQNVPYISLPISEATSSAVPSNARFLGSVPVKYSAQQIAQPQPQSTTIQIPTELLANLSEENQAQLLQYIANLQAGN